MRKFSKTPLKPFDEVFIITCKKFSDERGYFSEYFNQSGFQEVSGNATTFVQDNFSLSRKWVLRGLHFQKEPFAQAKLIRVLRGEIFDVVVDLRKKEKTFGKWAGVRLNGVDNRMLYVPEGFAHGFLSLSDKTELLYKCSSYFKKEAERTLHWSDSAIRILWPSEIPISNMIISEKDQEGLSLDRLLELDELF
ncbi:MAG: dTDP-4-dehydrorhamnose 3,5-epimerase [Burkholderiaceae bacterium]|nr:MAG: dTDP-4-dehydrorhamnose 3,5-epimerase [Burkholderiaceae bacterium]